ncbi:MAG: hypothetical protein MUF64_24120 [Polyangiaceae bacterium]|jgi:hypothetical protein|nr:hypothetical protein [Polyangiaceae bacterium]
MSEEEGLRFYERWERSFRSALKVPMVSRSTSRIGFLASPASVGNFLKLAIGVGLGACVADLNEAGDPMIHIQRAARAAEKASTEAYEAQEQAKEIDKTQKDLAQASGRVKRAQPKMVPFAAALAEQAKTHHAAAVQGVQQAQQAAEKATTAVKKARASRKDINAVQAARAEAEAALVEAEKGRQVASSNAVSQRLLSQLVDITASGVTPGALLELLVKLSNEAQEQTKAAVPEAEARVQKIEAAGEDDALVLLNELESMANKAREAVSNIEEAHKGVEVMQGALKDISEEDQAVLKTTLEAIAAAGKATKESAARVEAAETKGRDYLAKLGLVEPSSSGAQAAAQGAGGTSFFVVMGFLAWLLGRRASNKGIEANQEWRKKLPFSLTNYERALDVPTHACRALSLKLRFSAPPSLDELKARVQAFDKKITVTQQGKHFVLSRRGVQSALARTNRAALLWLTRAIDGLLMPLHGAMPLAEVVVTSSGVSTRQRAAAAGGQEEQPEEEAEDQEEEESDEEA